MAALVYGVMLTKKYIKNTFSVSLTKYNFEGSSFLMYFITLNFHQFISQSHTFKVQQQCYNFTNFDETTTLFSTLAETAWSLIYVVKYSSPTQNLVS